MILLSIFCQKIYLDKNKKYFIALGSIDMCYSWCNVSSEYKNNTFKFSKDKGLTWTTVTLPNGNYSYSDIQQAMRVAMGTKITLEFVSSRFRVLIKFDRPSGSDNDSHQLDFQTGNFAQLIGFDMVIVKNDELGPNLPDITRSIDNL